MIKIDEVHRDTLLYAVRAYYEESLEVRRDKIAELEALDSSLSEMEKIIKVLEAQPIIEIESNVDTKNTLHNPDKNNGFVFKECEQFDIQNLPVINYKKTFCCINKAGNVHITRKGYPNDRVWANIKDMEYLKSHISDVESAIRGIGTSKQYILKGFLKDVDLNDLNNKKGLESPEVPNELINDKKSDLEQLPKSLEQQIPKSEQRGSEVEQIQNEAESLPSNDSKNKEDTNISDNYEAKNGGINIPRDLMKLQIEDMLSNGLQVPYIATKLNVAEVTVNNYKRAIEADKYRSINDKIEYKTRKQRIEQCLSENMNAEEIAKKLRLRIDTVEIVINAINRKKNV